MPVRWRQTAVFLMQDRGKPVEFIGSQLQLKPAELAATIKTGDGPVTPTTLCESEPEPNKNETCFRFG